MSNSTAKAKESPLTRQVGGSHYKKYKIQPVEYAMANNLNYCQANAVKYITRYKDKGGIEDLRKAIHNIDLLIELEGATNWQVHLIANTKNSFTKAVMRSGEKMKNAERIGTKRWGVLLTTTSLPALSQSMLISIRERLQKSLTESTTSK